MKISAIRAIKRSFRICFSSWMTSLRVLNFCFYSIFLLCIFCGLVGVLFDSIEIKASSLAMTVLGFFLVKYLSLLIAFVAILVWFNWLGLTIYSRSFYLLGCLRYSIRQLHKYILPALIFLFLATGL